MKLKETLSNLTKNELYNAITKRFYLSGVSKLNKQGLIEVLYDYLTQEKTFKELLITLDNESLKTFIKVCNKKLDLSSVSFHVANKLDLIFYAQTTDEGTIEITDEGKELFDKIYKEPYISEQRKLNWMLQCINFMNKFYYITPMDIFIKLLRKTNYFSNNEKEIIDAFDKIPGYLKLCYYHDDEKEIRRYLNGSLYQKVIYEQGDKPYYIPTKKEIEELYLKQYIDNSSYQKYYSLFEQNYVLKELDQMMMFNDIACGKNTNDILKKIFDTIEVEDQEDAQYILDILMEVFNNTRLAFNRGYKPNELRKMYPINLNDLKIVPGSSKAKELLEQSNLNNIDTILPYGRKAYPNDECPCGSGKKYQDCCMYNDILKSQMH